MGLYSGLSQQHTFSSREDMREVWLPHCSHYRERRGRREERVSVKGKADCYTTNLHCNVECQIELAI